MTALRIPRYPRFFNDGQSLTLGLEPLVLFANQVSLAIDRIDQCCHYSFHG
ncbi:hypothetical protein A2U01_0080365, partial [Trifolium medium]|nr:hypothetical protein [Trifolium medium]